MRTFDWLLAPLAGAVLAYPAHAGGQAIASGALPTVAVIDSGVARTPELRDAVVGEYDMAAVPARPRFQPRYDHGTMVATILLREAGRPIDIVSFRIDDPAGCPAGSPPPCQPDAAPIARAIRKATELGVSVINLSLNLADDPQIVEAVREASDRGIKVVLAAGNGGLAHPGNLDMAKAGYPNAILVGALDAGGVPWQGTNRPEPGTPGYRYVWQPGVRVHTMLANGSRVMATGTSFAVPAEAALLLNDARVERRPRGQGAVSSAATVR